MQRGNAKRFRVCPELRKSACRKWHAERVHAERVHAENGMLSKLDWKAYEKEDYYE